MASTVVGMTKPQRDPSIDRLRHDVDDIYELIDDANQTAHTALAGVRGVDLRLRRFQRTTGHQFGVVIATLRQHSRRFDQIEGRLDRLEGRFDDRLGRIDDRLGQFDDRIGRIDDRLGEIIGLLRPR